MNTSPTVDELLEGFIVALGNEIMPFVSSPKAQATILMMQSLMQQVRQVLPVYDVYIAEEHNAMTKTLRDISTILSGVSGPEADRIRERATRLGALADVAIPEDQSPVRTAHRDLGYALQDTMIDLDTLQRAGHSQADEGLNILRAHLMPRIMRDVATVTVGAGMVGRG
jgi:hypothetical protein